jgi:hypothetical protein
MRAASVLLPDDWARNALDKCATRKIRYKQAPNDPRNRLYASREGANRAAPPEALAATVEKLDELHHPLPAILLARPAIRDYILIIVITSDKSWQQKQRC